MSAYWGDMMGEKETWDEAANLNSSRSNRVAKDVEDIAIGEEGVQRSARPRDRDERAEAINLNSSKSNVYRTGTSDAAGDPDGDPEPADSTIVKSKSNITNN